MFVVKFSKSFFYDFLIRIRNLQVKTGTSNFVTRMYTGEIKFYKIWRNTYNSEKNMMSLQILKH